MPTALHPSPEVSAQGAGPGIEAATPSRKPTPTRHPGHRFADVAVFSPAVKRAMSPGHSGGVTEVVRAAREPGGCACAGTCGECRTRNPNRRISEPSTQAPAGGGAVAPPAPAGGPAAAAAGGAAAAGPARHAELQSGPRYTPNGTIAPVVAGGLKSAGPWDMDAQFKIDHARGVYANCGEVHQDIKWDAAAAASFAALFGNPVPHGGFPAAHPANVWIEDRDQANTRYGRRAGPMSAPVAGGDEYTNAAGVQDMRNGAIYHGNDNPANWPAALAGRWNFMLLAFDMCNRGVQVGSADFIRIDW